MRWSLPDTLDPRPARGPSLASFAPSRSERVALAMRLASLTGVLEQPAGCGTALEIDSTMGRYRIDERGPGAGLVRHVGELVTVFAVVSPFATEGRRVLRVERFTLHEG